MRDNHNEISKPSDSDDKDPDSMIGAFMACLKKVATLYLYLTSIVSLSSVALEIISNQNMYYDGKVVFRLGLAAKKKHKYGEEETDWFNLELWGRDVESQGIML